MSKHEGFAARLSLFCGTQFAKTF